MGTVLHTDFETRSACDLRKCGVYVYGAHPTTQVLTIGFALDEDEPVWFMPGQESAHEAAFIDALAGAADTVAAHNAGFERRMLTDVLGPRLGYPVPAIGRWDCTAARAAIQSLPRSLDGALKALGAKVQKDKEGHALMMRMCKPRRVHTHNEPTFPEAAAEAAVGNLCFTFDGPHRVIEWWADQERIERLAAYMLDDVRGERALDAILAPMTPQHRETWELIEHLNDQGVPADIGFVNAARWMAHEAVADLDAKIKVLTNGAVPKASNVAGLKRWLQDGFGIDCGLPDEDDNEAGEEAKADDAEDASEAPAPLKLDKRRILDLLADPAISEIAKTALRIRQQAGKTSVKKYDAMLLRASADNRVRGNLVFHGASTGRLAGAGVQMQNMIRDVLKAWAEARADMNVLSLAEFEAKHGAPMEILSKMIRGFLSVPEDEDAELWWGDYAAVEARGVAWLSGCSKLVDLFASGGAVYEEMAHAIYPDLTVPEITRRDKAGEGIERFVGKQVVLGCFAADTVVLTDNGWKTIVTVSDDDLLWDGGNWVKHEGLIYQGYKKVETSHSLTATPDHEILTERGWQAWSAVHTEPSQFKSALASGRLSFFDTNGPLRTAVSVQDGTRFAGAIAALKEVSSDQISLRAARRNAAPAGANQAEQRYTLNTPRTCLMTRTDQGCSIDYLRVFPAATTPSKRVSTTTAAGASKYAKNGGRIGRHSCVISKLSADGINRLWKWTAKTTKKAMRRAISGLLPRKRTQTTAAPYLRCNPKSKNYAHVYDILNSGPRHRFTVLTNKGPLIVHNCVYGMGPPKFVAHCDNFNVPVPLEVGQHAVSTYRTEYPEIPALWRSMEDAAKAAIQNPNKVFSAGHNGMIKFRREGGWLKMRLPSGRIIWYCRPRLVEEEKFGTMRTQIKYEAVNSMTKKWGLEGTWGGKLTENAVQGLCFDLIDHAKKNLRREGYNPLLSVHDEVINYLTRDRINAGASLDEMLATMCRLPAWAAGFPLKAEGKKGLRYSK